MKAGINSILAPILLIHSFFVQLPLAFTQTCTVLAGCITQKNLIVKNLGLNCETRFFPSKNG